MDTKRLLRLESKVTLFFFKPSSESLKCSLDFTITGVFLVTPGHLHDGLHQTQNAIEMCHSHSWRCPSWLETSDRPVSSGITFTVRTAISALKKVIFIIAWIQGFSKAVAPWLSLERAIGSVQCPNMLLPAHCCPTRATVSSETVCGVMWCNTLK